MRLWGESECGFVTVIWGGVGGQGNKQAGSSRIKSKPDLTVDPASSDRDWYTQFSSPEVTVITMCPSESF